MDKATPTTESPPVSPPQQAALHQDDAADDDENVKQLKECSALYLSLQVKHGNLLICDARSVMNANVHLLHKYDGHAEDKASTKYVWKLEEMA
ncbi:hypothetical protein Gogos_003509 [Gossypium gossypioides]|uniref:Uncharacterized protein n=1 Tax=Gossypium gossypioides TaxID=34282 RepID=A0A7J9CMF5_GOSGO|nr:hypothetical protein [Gossypium gossypioides]